MAGRSKTSSEKRRKEAARREKQRMKDERRAQRKLTKDQPGFQEPDESGPEYGPIILDPLDPLDLLP